MSKSLSKPSSAHNTPHFNCHSIEQYTYPPPRSQRIQKPVCRSRSTASQYQRYPEIKSYKNGGGECAVSYGETVHGKVTRKKPFFVPRKHKSIFSVFSFHVQCCTYLEKNHATVTSCNASSPPISPPNPSVVLATAEGRGEKRDKTKNGQHARKTRKNQAKRRERTAQNTTGGGGRASLIRQPQHKPPTIFFFLYIELEPCPLSLSSPWQSILRSARFSNLTEPVSVARLKTKDYVRKLPTAGAHGYTSSDYLFAAIFCPRPSAVRSHPPSSPLPFSCVR